MPLVTVCGKTHAVATECPDRVVSRCVVHLGVFGPDYEHNRRNHATTTCAEHLCVIMPFVTVCRKTHTAATECPDRVVSRCVVDLEVFGPDYEHN